MDGEVCARGSLPRKYRQNLFTTLEIICRQRDRQTVRHIVLWKYDLDEADENVSVENIPMGQLWVLLPSGVNGVIYAISVLTRDNSARVTCISASHTYLQENTQISKLYTRCLHVPFTLAAATACPELEEDRLSVPKMKLWEYFNLRRTFYILCPSCCLRNGNKALTCNLVIQSPAHNYLV